MRKHDCAAHLLVGVTAVNTKPDMQFYSFVEFSVCGLANELQRLCRIVKFSAVNKLYKLFKSLFLQPSFTTSSSVHHGNAHALGGAFDH